MITPKDVRDQIEQNNISYGENVVFPDEIDTSNCSEFFGTRCSENVHVTGKRTAHVDQVDPRKNPIGHLKKDVGVPYALMTSIAGAALGAGLSKNNRKKGALAGALIGALPGAVFDILEKYESDDL